MRRIIGAAALLAATCSCSQLDQSAAANDEVAPAGTETAATATGGPPLALAASDAAVKWGPCPPVFTKPGCELTVLRGDPARPGADVMLRIPGGYAIPAHRHTSAERMILVGGDLRVRYQGHPQKTLAAGHYAYGPAGLAHEGACTSTGPCTLFIAFDGPVDAEAVTEPIA
ncbi:MAG TPA: cupin domain-containing protein [Sphingomicrobium sp.]|nr:cupin domain-containing protein [Sphingomicrobium sp.]